MSLAQGPEVQRVRVLGDVMAQQVVSKVAPAYPALAKEKGISGEVELYAAVGKDGAVEQVALVHGPAALLSAAADAVKQWRFRPYLVNGQPVEVDTTVRVDFSDLTPVAASDRGVSGAGQPLPPAATRPAPVTNHAAANTVSGGIDWEYDRKLGEGAPDVSVMVASVSPGPAVRGTSPAGPTANARVRPAAVPPGVVAPVTAAGIPQVGVPSPGNGIPLITPLPPATPDYTAVKPRAAGIAAAQVPVTAAAAPVATQGTATGAVAAVQENQISAGDSSRAGTSVGSPAVMAAVSQPAMAASDPGVGIVEAEGPAGITEWKLIRKVQPVYPAAAVAAGVEGVVVVDGTVKKDGTLHDLHAISGPPELQQAAVNAAAQYIYEPALTGNRVSEARTQVAVDFLLTGPAAVAPEVMAGRLMSSAYPPEALRAGVSGYVTLHALIGREGQVKTVTVISGPEQLRATALDAVKQWKWLPYQRNGVDVDVETDVVVHFSIPAV